MATNSSLSNVNCDEMDVDKPGVVDEEGQKQSIKYDLTVPDTLFTYMHAFHYDHDNKSCSYWNYWLLPKIDESEIKFNDVVTTTIHENGKSFRAFLVYDTRSQHFYSFVASDTNNKNQTMFSMNDADTVRVFEHLVRDYDRSNHFEKTEQLPEKDVSIEDQSDDDDNASTFIDTANNGNVNGQSECVLKGSGVCSLLVQNIQNLIPYFGPHLDKLTFSFKCTEYQLADNDVTSLQAVSEALNKQLRILFKLSDVVAESLKTHCAKSTSTDSVDTTNTTRNALLNNHEPNILSSGPLTTEQSLTLNSQTTIVTNTSPPLATTDNTNGSIQLSKLELLNQPKRFWHTRELATVGKGCPSIQVEGASERTPFALKLPAEIQFIAPQDFYIGIHVVTFDGKEHAQKLAIPKGTSVTKNHKSMLNKLKCLIFETRSPYEFDQQSKGVFAKVDLNKCKDLQMQLTIKMINLYQDADVNKDLIKKDKLIWCRLRFAIYIKMSNNQFNCISPPTYSDLIEETRRSQSLDIETIFPNVLCERGGQMIFIRLDESVKKDQICVRCNGEDLSKNKFQVAQKNLSFESPPSVQGRNHLDVHVHILNTDRPISFALPYLPHDNHPDPCGVLNED